VADIMECRPPWRAEMGAEWIRSPITGAAMCLDPYYVVAWAMKALDKIRVRTTAAAGRAVRKNPADLSGEQRTSLATIQATNTTLYRAYLLKAATPGDFSHTPISPNSSNWQPPSAGTATCC